MLKEYVNTSNKAHMSEKADLHDRPNRPRPPLQPPSGHTYNNFMSTLSYFTEPVTYTFSGLIRRLSEDEAPTPLAHALSANFNDSGMLLTNTPPKRRLSPFQPPPLTPLQLRGYKDSTQGKARLLRTAVAEEIRLLIPPRLQLMEDWKLVYSLEQDGSTLQTLYANCDPHRGKRGGFVLVVRDGGGGAFGAYLSDPPKPQAHYFGNGECFLWRAFVLPALPDLSSLPPPPSADTTHLQRMTTVGAAKNSSSTSLASTPDRIRFKAFPYTGENDWTIFCQSNYFSVGGGDGHYGLWLDANLRNGVSDSCPTFGNEPLSEEGSKFEVLGVEVWYIGS